MTVSIKFSYIWSHEWNRLHGHESQGEQQLWHTCNINSLPLNVKHPFYLLCGALASDFYPNHPEHCDFVLQKIAQIESGEIEEYMWEGQGFLHYIKPDSVLFEHNIFGECPEWPLWSCSLAQYKAALLGWKKFIEMPKSIDSEFIVELPDDGSSNFPHS